MSKESKTISTSPAGGELSKPKKRSRRNNNAAVDRSWWISVVVSDRPGQMRVL
jgi:hypothetical protein